MQLNDRHASFVHLLRWLMPCPGKEDLPLRLRLGLRGRRTISTRSHESVRGRTFEWWIETIDSRHDIAAHGSPLWVAREITASFTTLGQRIIGRVLLPSGAHGGCSNPALLWQAISRYCGPRAPRFTGVACTGLIHPSVQGCPCFRALALAKASTS